MLENTTHDTTESCTVSKLPADVDELDDGGRR